MSPTDGLQPLHDQVRASDRTTRIEFRDRVVDHGTAAIGPMAGWLNDREFAGFAVRVLERVAGQPEHRDAVVRVLQAASGWAATPTIAGDIRAALDHLAGRLVRPQALAVVPRDRGIRRSHG
jgi:hypothetical protein